MGAVVASAVLLLGQPALAASAEVRSVTETAPNRVEVLLAATGLADAQQLRPESLRVNAGGRPLKATARAVLGGDPAVSTAPAVMLALDTSGSMAGDRIVKAREAATAYVDGLPAEVAVGLTVFAERPTVLVRPTRDRGSVRRALLTLVAAGGTSLYDGVLAASDALGGAGPRRVLLLSDGADSTSRADLEQAVVRVRQAGVVLNAVRLGDDAAADRAVRRLTEAGQGKVVATADAAGLDKALAQAGQDRVTQVLATVEIPADLAGAKVPLNVVVAAGAERLVARDTVVLPGRLPSPGVPTTAGFLDSPAGYAAGAGAVGVALLLLVWLFLSHREQTVGDGGRTKQLLDMYTLHPRQPDGPKTVAVDDGVFSTPVAQRALEVAERFAQRRGAEERLTLALDRAAVALRPAEWLLLRGAIATVAVLAALVLSGNLLLALVLAALVGGLLPVLYLRFRSRRRQRAFVDGLPDALQLIAGSLSAGYSLPQALDAVVREGSQPISGELGRAMAESRLGVPIEEALDTVAERMDVPDFRWVVMAIKVQREVGGNLSGVLTTVTQTMRERAKLRRTIRALSAEGRLSAYVLVGLPICITLFLLAFRREYMRPLYTETAGIVMSLFAVLLVLAGSAFMAKLVKVEA